LNTQLHQTYFEPDQEKEYLRLETIGRRSRAPHSVLVRFVTVGSKIIVFPQNAGKQDWLLNLTANPDVKMFKDTSGFSARAQLRTISGIDDPVLKIFTRKYGIQTVRQRYWGQHRYVELQITNGETLALDQLVYDDLEAAFDGVAETYDRHIFENPINTWLRSISVRVLKQHFAPGDVVLELGCGTGTETLSLAEHGVTVLACDISGKMLRVLERKAKLEGLQEHVLTIHCRAGDLKDRLHALGFDKIDGAYSTYGAINTEPRLDNLFRDLRDLLGPGKPLILGVWNRYCLYEIAGYILRGRPRLAFARLRNPVPIGRSRFCVSSNAYSVASLNQYLELSFKLKSVHGVVILLPPSNLTRYLPKGKWLGLLKTLDLQLGRTFPFNRLGDHFLAVYTASE
jgi:deazaflavin-dependent oxidoreductase (nitroreductase family)